MEVKATVVTKRSLNRPIIVGHGEGILMSGNTMTNFGKKKVRKHLKHMLKKSKTTIMIHQKKTKKKYLLQFSPFFWRLGTIETGSTNKDAKLRPVFVEGKESS